MRTSFLRSIAVTGAISGLLAGASTVAAHVSISSGPVQATKNHIVTFSVGHGCEVGTAHHDTYRIKVSIPAGVTGVRALRSDFGLPTVIKTGDVVTSVSWQKPLAELLPDDTGYYEIKIRFKAPDAALSKLQFNVEQVCRSVAGVETTVQWNEPAGGENEAPQLVVTPAHLPGWNKVTARVAVAADDMAAYFGDAQIVWRGTAAFSINEQTTVMIGSTAGVTALTEVAAGDQLWVRY